MEQPKCAKCGSEHMMPDLALITGPSLPSVGAGKGFLGLSSVASVLHATVCADCGLTEVYAKEPRKLWDEWRKSNP